MGFRNLITKRTMENKIKIRLTEIFIQLFTGIATIIIQPPLPLLAIPFLIIITMRSICARLEDAP